MSEQGAGDHKDTVKLGVERFRAVRRELEASVLPLASSLDGRRFTFQASLHGLEVRLGGYVVVEHEGSSRLGQVLALEPARADGAEIDLPAEDATQAALRSSVAIRFARGEGALLEGDGAPFHDAMVRAATPDEVRGWTRARAAPRRRPGDRRARAVRGRARRPRRRRLRPPHVPVRPVGLGQDVLARRGPRAAAARRPGSASSCSTPTRTSCGSGRVREGADPAAAERYRRAAGAIAVHSARETGERRLRIRLAEIDPAARAALLRLDPIADREEHAELNELLAEGRATTAAAMAGSQRPERQRLALRARNLGVERFGIWAGGQPGSTLDAVHDPAARCVVVDLGSLPTPDEQALAAEAVLGELWRRREERNPVLIVIDEAHNVCPAQPEDPLTALATEHAVRIAAEGRKFGLYMLVSTQRPQKVHENVISQCDNLVLMRLNSAADAAFAQGVFSFVPPRLVEQASAFRLGEALVAGKISPHPALVRFGARIAEEGGSDVPATWAAAN